MSARGETKRAGAGVIEAALRRLTRLEEGVAPARPAAPLPPPRSAVLAAAQRRLAREGTVLRGPRAQAQEALSASLRRTPIVTLEPPKRRVDAGALAALLAEDAARKLDQLCYVWSVIQELEPFAGLGEGALRRRAAELLLVAGGGDADIPLEGPLRAARSFLRSHGMHEEYVESLCAWYLDGGGSRGAKA